MKSIKYFIKENVQFLLLVILVLVFSMLIPSFMTKTNIVNIMKQSSTIAMITCGVALVVISGNLDLSVGSMLSLTLGLSISMSQFNTPLAIIVPIFAALVIGAVNGYFIGRFKVNSIIMTLGMLSLLNGVIQTYRKGNIVVGFMGTSYQAMTDAKLFGIPSFIIVYFVMAFAYEFILRKTVFGRALVYMGINRDAAETAGINTKRVTVITFMICAFSVAVASILMGARLLQGSTNTGAGLEFDALTAILIGGISIDGGKGSIFNAMIGVFLLAVIINGLTLLNVPFEWRFVAKGLLILSAILFDKLVRGRNE